MNEPLEPLPVKQTEEKKFSPEPLNNSHFHSGSQFGIIVPTKQRRGRQNETGNIYGIEYTFRLYAMFTCANLYALAIAGRKLSTT